MVLPIGIIYEMISQIYPLNDAFLLDDINDVWDAWRALFMEAVERNIPARSLKHKRNVPRFNSELKTLVLKKRRLLRKGTLSNGLNTSPLAIRLC